jgi:hypothetical protein
MAYDDMADDDMPEHVMEGNTPTNMHYTDPTEGAAKRLRQGYLTIEEGSLIVSSAAPPSEQDCDLDAPEEIVHDKSVAPLQQLQPAPIYTLMGETQRPGCALQPGEHRLAPPVDEVSPDDHVPLTEVAASLQPLGAFLLAESTDAATDLHPTASSELSEGEGTDIGGVESEDDEGNGWLGGVLESRICDGGLDSPRAASKEDEEDTAGAPAREFQWPDSAVFDQNQLEALKAFLENTRLRGGDAGEERQDADSAGEEQNPAVEGYIPEPEVGENLTRSVWSGRKETECCLKVLQACQLLAEYKERHRTTGPAMEDLLKLLQVLLPPGNLLPRTLHMFRKVASSVLLKVFGGSTFTRLHMCADPECTHMYMDTPARVCPICGQQRYKKLQDGTEQVRREIRYMGARNGVKTLLMSTAVGAAIEQFDLEGALQTPHSLYASPWSEHICREHIPCYENMSPERQQINKYRFFSTGQVCDDVEWGQYQLEVNNGSRMRTKLLIVEGGTDGFQPHNRRQWSTWVWGYRLNGINWALGNVSGMEIVTAICEGATEGKAAQVVAYLDAQQFRTMAPPIASDRERIWQRQGACSLCLLIVPAHCA